MKHGTPHLSGLPCFLPSGLHVLLPALCPQRTCSSYFLGHGYPEAQTGQGRWDKVWSGLCDVLICDELTMTPHTFLQALPFASRVASKPAGDADRETRDGHKIIWVPAVPILGVLACKPRNKQRMPFKWDLCVPGTCVYNMNRRRTGDMLL